VDLPLGFPVERGQRYRIAVDSAVAGETGGVRLFLDYEEARLDARPLFGSVPAGQRPLVHLTVRNTSPHERLRVYGMDNSNGGFAPVDCPVPFTVAPGASRSCTVLANATGPAGSVVRGRLSVYVEWPDRPRYATLADPWFARVRR